MVSIDKDPSQFRGCKARLVDYKANMDVEHKVEVLEVAQVQQLKKVARRFASWLPGQVEEVEVEEVEAPAQATPASDMQEEEELTKTATCITCNPSVDTVTSVPCNGALCGADHLHQHCAKV